MSLYDQTVTQFSKMLGNLENWLDEAVAHAEARGFDPEVLLEARLAPDMFTLRRQIQSCCDTAKLSGARLTEADVPVHEDGDDDLAALRARIAEVRAFLGGLSREGFEGVDTRELSPGFLQGLVITGADYAREFAVPNFYFHATTAYGILRHNGVKLGKRPFLGSLEVRQPS